MCFLCICNGAIGQKPPFEAEIKNSSPNTKVIPLHDGGYLVHDAPNSYQYSYYNSYDSMAFCNLIRYDRCFNTLWSKKYLSVQKATYYGNYFSPAIAQTKEGGFILANYNEEVANLWPVIHKLDVNGELIWSVKLYFDVPASSAKGYGIVEHLMPTDDSGIIVFGYASYEIPGNDQKYYAITKLNKFGDVLWSKRFLLPNFTMNCPGGSSLAVDNNNFLKLRNGGFLLTFGWMTLNAANSIFKFDDNGNIVWAKGIRKQCENRTLFGGDAIEDDIGNIYVRAHNHIIDSSKNKPMIVKLNENGSLLWAKNFSCHGFISDLVMSNNKLKVHIRVHADSIRYIKPTANVLTTLNQEGSILYTKVVDKNRYHLNWIATNNLAADIYGDILIPGNYYIKGFRKIHGDSSNSCGVTDTTLTNNSNNIDLISTWLPFTDGYKAEKGKLHIINEKRKIKISCGKEFYPISDLGNDSIICNTKSYTLNAGQDNLGYNHKFSWSNGSTDSVITVTKSGKYWLAISSGYCTNTDTVTIIFRDEIQSNIPNQSICPYDSVFVKAPTVATSKFYWIKPDKSIFKQHDIWAKDTGTYYLMLEGNGNCMNIDTFRLQHYDLPKASAGPDTVLCYNQPYRMQGKGGISYLWTPAKYLSNPKIPDPIATAPDTQLYMLVVKNAFGCADTSYMWLKVKPKLEVKLQAKHTAVCGGEKIIVQANATGGNQSAYTYKWQNTEVKTPAFETTLNQNGWIKVTLQDGCSEPAQDSIFITVKPTPIAAFYTTPIDTAIEGNKIQFINQSRNSTTYKWSFGNGGTSLSPNPSYIYTDTGKYFITLVAQNQNGCTDTAFGQIYIGERFRIFIPNTFTPDGDLVNDVFSVYGTGIKDYSYKVYNRWGQIIFTSTPTQKSWNGAVNNSGQTVQMDVYFYVLEVKDLENRMHYFNGTVNLLR